MKTVLHAFAFVFIPVVITILGAGLSLWAWMNGQPLPPALLLSVLLLAAAQLIFYFGSLLRPDPFNARMGDVMRMFAGLKGETASLARRVGNLEKSAPAAAGAKKNDAGKPKPRKADAKSPRPAAATRPVPARPTSVSGPAIRPAAKNDTGRQHDPKRDPMSDYRLYMEPVADLRTRRTAFYRAAPALAAKDGRIFLGDQAGLRAAQLGMAAPFDMATLRQAAGFIRRLREKGREAFVICPLSRASMSSRKFRGDLKTFMASASDVAGNVVLDISHSTLSSLNEDGTLGLAWLAQNGVRLSLSSCDPDRIDPEALKKLGFAFLDMDMKVITRALSAGGGDALRRAAAPGLVIIASGVDTPELEARARPFVHLARGRVFSPPRRVRQPEKAKQARRDAA